MTTPECTGYSICAHASIALKLAGAAHTAPASTAPTNGLSTDTLRQRKPAEESDNIWQEAAKLNQCETLLLSLDCRHAFHSSWPGSVQPMSSVPRTFIADSLKVTCKVRVPRNFNCAGSPA